MVGNARLTMMTLQECYMATTARLSYLEQDRVDREIKKIILVI